MTCAHAHVLKKKGGAVYSKKWEDLAFVFALASDRAHCWRQRLQVSAIHSVLLHATARD